jgi:asparagine synthase (glutamine-hydrolysing)
MCGIAGIASTSAVGARDWLATARDAMAHRGPDDVGEWWSPDSCVGLGHRRLSIVDLSPAGHQPMLPPQRDLCIVYNGEIYNYLALREQLAGLGHRFVSESDTEVILAAYREWGNACLGRLHGMYALALYDLRSRRLLLARDRAGEKPLFYAPAQGSIRFASELKALFADPALPRRLDWSAFDCYLADGYVAGDGCIIEGLKKLPAAHAMEFDVSTGQSRVWRYWEPPRFSSAAVPSDEALLDELQYLLGDAVRRQLIADVPVGVLLSGGVDSSIVTALAAAANSSVQTFTVRFPGHGAHDETEHARLIANHFGTRHVEIEADAADVSLLPRLARQFDEPMTDSSMVPTYLVSRMVRQHCTVALGGDGGDELFGGYPHYDRLLRMQRTFAPVPRFLRSAVGAAAGELIPPGVKGRTWLQALGTDLRTSIPPILQIFDKVTRRRLMHANPRWRSVAEAERARRLGESGELLDRATRLDFQTYLADDLLVKVDRAAMLSSLEVRAPLLDVSVIEFAFGRVPAHLKATTHSRKILLKRLAGRLLPPAFDRARKQGFSIPLSSWLQAGPWREFFRSVLLDDGVRWFDRHFVERLLDAEGPARNNGEKLFGLVMFELWRREYRIEMSA